MHVHPYLNFPGTCREAFAFYEKTLGGQIAFAQTHGESPMADQVGADWQDRIMHIRLEAPGAVIMGSDAPPGYHSEPAGFYVSVQVEDPADAERMFAAFAQDGEVHMPITETFWAKRFGMCKDRFGIPWMINCENPDYPG